jgi:hypothetical protein
MKSKEEKQSDSRVIMGEKINTLKKIMQEKDDLIKHYKSEKY